MKEMWKRLIYPKIPEEDNRFEISSYGVLKNTKTGYIYKPSLLNTGYYSVRVTLGERSKKIHILLHKAVAWTFLINPNNLPCVNHIDGNKTNNHIDNLEWCTYGQNLQHAYDNNLFNKESISGSNNHSSKLTKEDVEYIREHYIKGSKTFGSRALAMRFDVSHNTILSIIKYVTWKTA